MFILLQTYFWVYTQVLQNTHSLLITWNTLYALSCFISHFVWSDNITLALDSAATSKDCGKAHCDMKVYIQNFDGEFSIATNRSRKERKQRWVLVVVVGVLVQSCLYKRLWSCNGPSQIPWIAAGAPWPIQSPVTGQENLGQMPAFLPGALCEEADSAAHGQRPTFPASTEWVKEGMGVGIPQYPPQSHLWNSALFHTGPCNSILEGRNGSLKYCLNLFCFF